MREPRERAGRLYQKQWFMIQLVRERCASSLQAQGPRIKVCGPMLRVVSETSGSPTCQGSNPAYELGGIIYRAARLNHPHPNKPRGAITAACHLSRSSRSSPARRCSTSKTAFSTLT
jgi:hypothetical protein